MHFLARDLFKKDGRNGSTFYSSLSIPPAIKGNLLQRILLDGGQRIPPLKDLRLTYGNRIAMSRQKEAGQVFEIICPEDFSSSTEHLHALEKEFELLNDPAKSFKQRLNNVWTCGIIVSRDLLWQCSAVMARRLGLAVLRILCARKVQMRLAPLVLLCGPTFSHKTFVMDLWAWELRHPIVSLAHCAMRLGIC